MKLVGRIEPNQEKKEPNQEVVAMLESQLKSAKEGEIQSLISIIGYSSYAFSHEWAFKNHFGQQLGLAELSVVSVDLATCESISRGTSVILDCDK